MSYVYNNNLINNLNTLLCILNKNISTVGYDSIPSDASYILCSQTQG
jgi:hypothetical protein